MTYADEPFVVCHDPAADRPDPRCRLADVLVTAADGRPRAEQLAAIFAACPGLTLVLVVGADRTVEIGTRDGATASLRLDPSVSVELAAVVLYHGWVGQLSANGPRPW